MDILAKKKNEMYSMYFMVFYIKNIFYSFVGVFTLFIHRVDDGYHCVCCKDNDDG